MTENVHKLQEMGFSEAQAKDALAATSNDLTKAISYLFGETDEGSGTGTQQAPYIVDQPATDTVNLANPQDLPSYVGDFAMKESQDPFVHGMATGIEHAEAESGSMEVRLDDSTDDAMNSGNSDNSDIENSSMDSDSGSDLYPENVKTDGHTVAVVMNRTTALQPWVPLVSILARYPPVAKAILESSSTSSFARELQRIVYFIHNFDESKRWYVTTDGLAGSAPTSYSDEDMVLNMLEHMMKEVPELSPVLQSMVESPDEDVNKELTVLEIESDSRSGSLYETLNELFWQKSFDFLGKIKYSSVAPVVVYQLMCDDSSYCDPFGVPESFYPEIYSDVALPQIQTELQAVRQAEKDYHSSSRALMDLNFFEGKRIDSLLKSATKALQENTDASADLQGLSSQLADTRKKYIDQQTEFRAVASASQLKSYDRIISDNPKLRQYKLFGAALSEDTYFVRVGDTWLEMDAGVTVNFTHVRDTISEATQQGPHLVTLYYGLASEMTPIELKKEEEEKGEVTEEKEDSSPELIDLSSDSNLPGELGSEAPAGAKTERTADEPDPSAKKPRRESGLGSVEPKFTAITVSGGLVSQFMHDEEENALAEAQNSEIGLASESSSDES